MRTDLEDSGSYPHTPKDTSTQHRKLAQKRQHESYLKEQKLMKEQSCDLEAEIKDQ